MQLDKWTKRFPAEEEMLWKSAAGAQIRFVRDELGRIVFPGLTYAEMGEKIDVVSTHRSKSIDLPVFGLFRDDLGCRIFLRNNFYNWKVSVSSGVPIVADFTGLFHTSPPPEPEYTGNPLNSCYFEGFPEEIVYDYYDAGDKCKFSAEIHGDHSLWTTVFLIMRARGAVKPMFFHTRASHRAELDAQKE